MVVISGQIQEESRRLARALAAGLLVACLVPGHLAAGHTGTDIYADTIHETRRNEKAHRQPELETTWTVPRRLHLETTESLDYWCWFQAFKGPGGRPVAGVVGRYEVTLHVIDGETLREVSLEAGRRRTDRYGSWIMFLEIPTSLLAEDLEAGRTVWLSMTVKTKTKKRVRTLALGCLTSELL